MTDPQSLNTAHTYDVLNRLSTLAFNGQTPAFGFGYDALSRRTSLTRPNSVNATYAYDPQSRLTSILHKLGTTTLDGATYTYDNAGNRATRTDKRLNTTLTYTYDNIYQLQLAKQGTTTKETYTYDAVGNRLSSLGVSPYAYNSSNELTSLPNVGYTYDNNGSTKMKTDPSGITTYTWDFENRLSSVALPGSGGTVSVKYDPFGRRIQKSGPSGTVDYLYDGSRLLEEIDQNGNVLANYTQGMSIDEPLAELRSGVTSYYHADGLGSVASLSNSAGALSNTYSYDSFGKLTASSGTLTNPFRYSGREFDLETGLYYYRARYYDAATGRFASEDPAGFDGSLNFYDYVENDPVDWTDPSGLDRTRVCCRPLHKFKPFLMVWHHCYIQIHTDSMGRTIRGEYSPIARAARFLTRMTLEILVEGAKMFPVTAARLALSKKHSILRSTPRVVLPAGQTTTIWWWRFDGQNSNTYVYDMITGAGMTPPSEDGLPDFICKARGPYVGKEKAELHSRILGCLRIECVGAGTEDFPDGGFGSPLRKSRYRFMGCRTRPY